VRVRCIANTGQALPESSIDSRRGLTAEKTFPLTIGTLYVVYAITMYRGLTWYYVLDDHDLPYPVWKPAVLFDIVSGTIPTGWVVGYVRVSGDDAGYPVISFPEWADDRFFYERLVDGDDLAVAVFERRRKDVDAV
jgi:hypothetical protein